MSVIAAGATLIALAALTEVRKTGQTNSVAKSDLQSLLLELRTAESSSRDYSDTDSPQYLTEYAASMRDARHTGAILDSETKNLSYRPEINKLLPLVQNNLAVLDETAKLAQTSEQDPSAMASSVATGTGLMNQIVAEASTIEAAQTAQLNSDRDSVQALSDVARDISVITVILTLIFAAIVNHLYLTAIKAERQLDRAKDEFVSLASHQLRTPATGIKSILATIISEELGPLSERQAHFLKRAYESNEHELAIIDDLLNVAKADAGRLILRSTEFDLGKLVDAIASEQRNLIQSKNQKLTLKIPSRPVKMLGDEDKLYMAIANLLDNGSKYTPEFGKITIAIARRSSGVEVEVTDTGIGIGPEDLGRIFDRFARVGDNYHGNVAGSGLGLYLARRVAQLHGGNIEATSRLGKGTKFVMIIPQEERDATKSTTN